MSQSRSDFTQAIRVWLIDITNTIAQYLKTRFSIPSEIIDVIVDSVDRAIDDPHAITYLREGYHYTNEMIMFFGRHLTEVIIGSKRHHGLITGTLQVVGQTIRLIEQLLFSPFIEAREAFSQHTFQDNEHWRDKLKWFGEFFLDQSRQWGMPSVWKLSSKISMPNPLLISLCIVLGVLFLVEQAMKGLGIAMAWMAENIIVKGILQYLVSPILSAISAAIVTVIFSASSNLAQTVFQFLRNQFGKPTNRFSAKNQVIPETVSQLVISQVASKMASKVISETVSQLAISQVASKMASKVISETVSQLMAPKEQTVVLTTLQKDSLVRTWRTIFSSFVNSIVELFVGFVSVVDDKKCESPYPNERLLSQSQWVQRELARLKKKTSDSSSRKLSVRSDQSAKHSSTNITDNQSSSTIELSHTGSSGFSMGTI